MDVQLKEAKLKKLELELSKKEEELTQSKLCFKSNSKRSTEYSSTIRLSKVFN